MKRIIAMVGVAALLLTGCEQVSKDSVISESGAKVKIDEISRKTVTEIEMDESGGEDGRANNWKVFCDSEGRKLVVLTDIFSKESQTYEVSDEDYNVLVQIDFSGYIGKKDDNEGIADAVYYNITILYDDGSKATSETSILDLWGKLQQIPYSYEPIMIENDMPIPEMGTV